MCPIVQDQSGRSPLVSGTCLLVDYSAQTAILSQMKVFSDYENFDSDIPDFPDSSPSTGALFAYRRMRELHDDDGAKKEESLAVQALDPFYLQIAKELPAELFAASEALGQAKGTAVGNGRCINQERQCTSSS